MINAPTMLYKAWDYTHEKMHTHNISAFSVEGTNVAIELNFLKKTFEYLPNTELLPFIGKQDKDLVNIFSGDILAFCLDHEAYEGTEIVAEVQWSSFWSGWILWNWNAPEGKMDIPIGENGIDLIKVGAHIVGNKFENPELLSLTHV